MRFVTSLILLILTLVLLLPKFILAQSLDELDQELKDKQAQIQKLEGDLLGTRKKERTLESQLQFIDTQTNLTKLKIEQTKFQILKLDKEVEGLDGRIDRVSVSVDNLTKLLLDRIVKTYKYSNVNPLDLFFSSAGFSDFLDRIKYLQVVQAHDKKTLYQLQAAKVAYRDQKQDKLDRQTKQANLRKELETYNVQLQDQRQAKGGLLAATQNDETKYEDLIKKLQAEVSSITQAISNVGPKIGNVSKGDRIAGMGSTGCSTGPHLHFEVYENAKVEDGRIIGTRVNPHNYLDNGKLGSPLDGYPSDTIITTEYGEIYFLGTHTGLDIAPKDGGGLGRSILAAESGVAYSTQASCSYSIPGGSSVGKGIIIDHQNGLVTLYWHIL